MPSGVAEKTAIRAEHHKEKEGHLSIVPEFKSYLPEEFIFKKKKGTHNPLYTPLILPRIEELASKGFTNKAIAKSLGIGQRTLYDWIERFPQLAHSLKKYRGLADIEVENSLYKSALGYNVTEVKRERRRVGTNEDGTPKYEMVLTEDQQRYIPGTPASQIFYLKNRMPDRYKDKIENVLTLGEDISQIAFAIKRRGQDE